MYYAITKVYFEETGVALIACFAVSTNQLKTSEMLHYNRKTRITATAIGVVLGLSGILNHGLFEILQGNTPTNGFFIEAIGERHRFWLHGTEAAFTLIHNFLLTGISAVLAGLAVVYWSVKYMHAKHGATVFLLLLAALTLVGGGIGFILLYLPAWAFATRINASLEWWQNKLPARWRQVLSSSWKYNITATLISWLLVMELGIFGYLPGQDNPDAILGTVFVFLFTSVLLACLSFVSAIASDTEERNRVRVNYRLESA